MEKCDLKKPNERCRRLSAFGSQLHLHEQPSVTGSGRDRIWVVIKLPGDRGWRLGRLQVGSTGGWIGFEAGEGRRRVDGRAMRSSRTRR